MRMNTCIIWILMSLLVGLASCKKDPEIPTGTTFNSIYVADNSPSISILQDKGYVRDGAVIDVLGDTVLVTYGFNVASNPATQKMLSSLRVSVDDEELANLSLSNQSNFTYSDVLVYTFTRDEIIGESTIKAIVTDEANKTSTVSITIRFNQVDPALESFDFTWFRHDGNDGEGLAEYGLEWRSNAKEVFAVIKPVEGATLYGFDAAIWYQVTTITEKVAAFTEGSHSVLGDFRGVSVWNSKDYDFVIGTLYNGEYHLIHITKGVVDNNGGAGTDITISGQAK